MPNREQTMQMAFEAIHKLDALIFPEQTAIPNNWDAVSLAFHEAARLGAITIWRHLLWITDAEHRWPQLPILGPTEMLHHDIAERLAIAKVALADFEHAILAADPTAQITWERILEALSGMVNTLGPLVDHLLLHFTKAAEPLQGQPLPANLDAPQAATTADHVEDIPPQSVNAK